MQDTESCAQLSQAVSFWFMGARQSPTNHGPFSPQSGPFKYNSDTNRFMVLHGVAGYCVDSDLWG